MTLGSASNNIGGTFATAIQTQQGNTAPFPSFSENNIGTYGSGGFSSFTNASFSQGDLELQVQNNWPVSISMAVDLINATSGSTILSYTLSNVSAGSSASDSKSLQGITLPNNVAFKIVSMSSPGASSVLIDTTDAIDMEIIGTNLMVYNAVTAISTQTISADTQFVDLSTGGSEELRELYFNTADFDFSFTSSLAEDLELTIAFPGSDKNGAEVDTTITIASGQTTSGSINLGSTILDLTQDPSQMHSRLPIAVSATLIGSGNQVTVDSSDALDMTFGMSNLEFGYIKGYFGTQSLSIDPGAIDLAIDFLDNFEGSVSFAEPSITLDITNSIGLPIQFALDFSAYLDGIASDLNGPAYVLPYPTVIGNSASGSLIYDNTNSSIVDIFTLPKDSIVYGGSVNVNHDTVTYGTDNFVTNSGAISGNLMLDMPFYFTASGLGFADTLVQNRQPNDALNDSTSIEYAKLTLQASTTLPLDASIDLEFYDENWTLILVKTLPLLESGTPDANGNITTPNVLNTSLELDAMEADIAINTPHILATATMETSNAGTTAVRLRTDATINLAIGIELKLNVQR
jgi:hypothetical protein